jgi:hypothetical protein
MSNLHVHDKLFVMETALQKLNGGKGMGFVVYGSLVDNNTLAKISILGTPIWAALTAALAMSTPTMILELAHVNWTRTK